MKDNDLVVLGNKILESDTYFTMLDYKVFFSFVSKISKEDLGFWTYEVQVKNLGTYHQIKNSVRRLLGKSFLIELEETDKRGNNLYDGYSIFSSLKYRDGVLIGKFDNDLKPYLLGLKKCITKFGLSNILKLHSKYDIKLYTYFKKEQFKGTIELSIAGINSMFKTSYVWRDINRKILSNIESINQKTDIKVTYTTKKMGRKIVAIKFNIADDSFENFVKTARRKYYNTNQILTIDKQERAYYINEAGHIECQNIVLSKDDSLKVWKWVYLNKHKFVTAK